MTEHRILEKIFHHVIRFFLCLLPLASSAQTNSEHPNLFYYRMAERSEQKTSNYDIAIYGGTPAGVAAAVQSARMGKNVVLLSFDRHVGGMTSGGLTATDTGNKKAIGGMALEFYTRLGKMVDYSPSEAEKLYLKMLAESGVTVLYESCLESVKLDGNRIESATFETGETIKAAVYIDATYEGDLLAAANISYHVGREPVSTYGEPLNGLWQSVSWKSVYQFCDLPISPYVIADNPQSDLLPEISPDTHGKKGQGDHRVQAYNFRMRLSNKEGKIAFPKPVGYDPGRYALLARFINADPNFKWTLNYTTAHMTDGPVQMRNGDSNNAGSVSSNLVGGSNRWPDGTFEPVSFDELPAPRRGLSAPFAELYLLRESTLFQEHVKYQQGYMYFLANDPQVPSELQKRVNQFGLCPDEFKETAHWPHHLYGREGRRMLSDYVMTQANCQSERIAEDSTGLASYHMDSHPCQRVAVTRDGVTTVRNEGAFGLKSDKPYPISYRSIIPGRDECLNLFVPVCLSASHVAYGSIRMEPVFMILGQSAGTAASIAIDNKIPVQDVPYEKLSKLLKEQGQIL
jgi:hypothetical protein